MSLGKGSLLNCAAALALVAAHAGADAAARKPVAIALPAMPLGQALTEIGRQAGVRVAYDPDAVMNRTSAPVSGKRSVEAAVRAAVRGSGLTAVRNRDGSIDVVSDIVVTAQQDEAETGTLVRSSQTSSRTGQVLRDQPRNTTVITKKLLDDQQAVTLFDALRNTAGVTVNTGTVQGGNTYTVRGFASGGILNGMPAASSLGGNAGASQPLANVERIEVLKGPDAILAGVSNQGGTINIVTSKPFAREALVVSSETGSYGQIRGTVDANNTLNAAHTLSARIIATAASADRNFGGYSGNEDYLFAPSIRFKDAKTDLLFDVSTSQQVFGENPYTFFDPNTRQPVERAIDRPILSSDQSIRIGNTRLHADLSRDVTDWLTVVVRGQHETQSVTVSNFAPFGIFAGDGTAFVVGAANAQKGTADVVDGFARLKAGTGPIRHTIVAGLTHTWSSTRNYTTPNPIVDVFNLLTQRVNSAIPAASRYQYVIDGEQFGQYAQYLAEFWRIKLSAGVRHNSYSSTLTRPTGIGNNSQESKATTPNFGAVFDLTDNVAFFGNLAYGYVPSFAVDFAQNRLPDNRTRNLEGGVKLDLFGKKATINASYFELRQSNLLVVDPQHPGFQKAIPGQNGKGIDVNVSGMLLPGWSVQAGLTRTKFSFLVPTPGADVVQAQPRDIYNVYTSYNHKLSAKASVGIGGGLFGRSSASADNAGKFIVPASRQVDTNIFLAVEGVRLNLGVRNLFDRRNYGITYASSYLPYVEPRNWRLTASYKFR